MVEKIVMSKGGKWKYGPHANFSNIYAILEPLKYIQKLTQIRKIKVRNHFRYYLVQPLHFIDSKEESKVENWKKWEKNKIKEREKKKEKVW